MLPFCGYNMGDYFRHWLTMRKLIAQPPRIFHVNWFRKDEHGNFLWPGFGENMRVLKWIVERCEGGANARESALGFTPGYADLHWQGLEFGEDKFANITSIDGTKWREELAMHDELFAKLEGFVPDELISKRKVLQESLAG